MSIFFCGWVHKHGDLLQQWKRRYVVLKDRSLRIYRNDSDPQPTATLDVGEYKVVSNIDDQKLIFSSCNKPQFAFQLVPLEPTIDNGPLIMFTDTKNDMIGWIEVLNKATDPKFIPTNPMSPTQFRKALSNPDFHKNPERMMSIHRTHTEGPHGMKENSARIRRTLVSVHRAPFKEYEQLSVPQAEDSSITKKEIEPQNEVPEITKENEPQIVQEENKEGIKSNPKGEKKLWRHTFGTYTSEDLKDEVDNLKKPPEKTEDQSIEESSIKQKETKDDENPEIKVNSVPQNELEFSWINFLNQAGLEDDLPVKYAAIFEENQLTEADIVDIDHDLLKSINISLAKTRLKIIKFRNQWMETHAKTQPNM